MKRTPLEPEIDKRGDFEPQLPRSVRVRGSGVLSRLKQLAKRGEAYAANKTRGRRNNNARGKLRVSKAQSQRVIVKARVVKGSGKKAVHRLRAHLSYLNRSGTGLTDDRPQFFGQDGYLDRAALSKRAAEWANDPHHFRFIVSPERGNELELEQFVKQIAKTIELDVKSKLEWYGTCHYNTDNPHVHLVVRGIDDKGQPLLLTRDYLSHGIRHVAENEATLRLGKRDKSDIKKSIGESLKDLRFTFIDAELKRTQDDSPDKTLKLEPLWGAVREWQLQGRKNKLIRLAYLESKGLAKELKAGVWKLDENLEVALKELNQRRSIVETISPLLALSEARKQELVIHRESEPLQQIIRGAVIAKDLSDELNEKSFVIVSGDDARTHYIPLGRFSESKGFECRAGQIIRVEPAKTHAVRAEDVIQDFLQGREAVFDIAAFQRHVSTAVSLGNWKLPEDMTLPDYMEIFAIRCESLDRQGIIKRISDGKWQIPKDLLERIQEREEVNQKKLKTIVSVESARSFAEQVHSAGATWLDRHFSFYEQGENTIGAFGREVRKALDDRELFLKSQGVSLSKNTFWDLLDKEEKLLKARLEKVHGPEVKLAIGQECSAKVVSYELLGDGYRMVAKTEQGFVLRKVSSREAQFPFESQIMLSNQSRFVKGKPREVIRARAVEKRGHTQDFKLRRK